MACNLAKINSRLSDVDDEFAAYTESDFRTEAILSTDSPVKMVLWSPLTVTISTLLETTCKLENEKEMNEKIVWEFSLKDQCYTSDRP